MNSWKRNAVVGAVLLFVCAGIYLNWSFNQKEQAAALEDTLNVDALQDEEYRQTLQDAAEEGLETARSSQGQADSFAAIRLSRQQSRDSAISLLQETISYSGTEEGTAEASAAEESLQTLVSDALQEAQIESMVIAKGYADCVAYMSDEAISLAVAAPEGGLQDADVALLADIVASQTDYALSAIRIIEISGD